MLSIIGNIKITNELRFKYLICCIKSLWFASNVIDDFKLNIENLDSAHINQDALHSTLAKFNQYTITNHTGNFGDVYMSNLNKIKSEKFLHFEEDHFCLLDDVDILKKILLLDYDICKASFHTIEIKCADEIHHSQAYECGKIYDMNRNSWINFSKPYGSRYYIGNNAIFSTEFGRKYWSRNIAGNRPHVFEVQSYTKELEHSILIPSHEILCAIDDDHGESNTCLLNRSENKWKTILNDTTF